MKKRVLSLVLAALMFAELLPCAYAGADEKKADLVVETMSGTYYFNVGDTFSYSFWLRVSADFINYAADEITAATAGSDFSDKIGKILSNKDILANSKMKSVFGAVYFDPDYLALQETFMPELKSGICASTANQIVKTALELVGGDTTRTGAGFYCSVFSDEEQTKFNNEALVLVQCFFKVKQACDEPVRIRTRLAKLTVSANINGIQRDLDLVKKSKAYFTYESYDTINDEAPTVMLKSLVADCAFDVRCIMNPAAKDTYIRPDKGVTVNMMGFTFDGRYIKLTGYTPASGVVWFYDVPYGEFYVNCAWKNASGQSFATANWATAEHVNIPATGSVQALWLFYEDPGEKKDVDVYITWEGDNGYIPARPEAIMAYLYKVSDPYAAAEQMMINPEDEMASFYYVDAFDDGEPVYYKLELEPAAGEWDYKCTYEHLIPGIDEDVTNETFYVTCTYTGPESALDLIEPDEYGHYWELVTGMTGSATCTEPGTAYYMCLVCHQFKHEEVGALGHVWGSWKSDGNATCSADGTKTHKCLRCGASETVTDPGSRNDAHVWGSWISDKNASCTKDGTKTRKCTLCTASETVADAGSATGHKWGSYISDGNAACTVDGTKTRNCTVEGCGAHETVTDAGSALGHSWGTFVYNNDETCSKDGTSTAKCTRAGCKETKTVTVTGSAKHLWGEWVSDGNATADEDGTKTRKCTRCTAHETITDIGSATGHTFGQFVPDNNATCTEPGTMTAHCTDKGCSAERVVEDPNAPALGHSWSDWAAVGDATCTSNGTLEHHCTRAGCTAKETVPAETGALGHSWSEWRSDGNATCEKDGTKTHICMNKGCSAKETVADAGSALGHKWSAWVSDGNATCEKDGTKTHVCMNKGCTAKETVTDTDSALGHNYDAGICTRCHKEQPGYSTKFILQLPDGILRGGNEIYIDGVKYEVGTSGKLAFDDSTAKTAVVYTYNTSDMSDIQKVYPTHMYVYLLSCSGYNYSIKHIEAFDDILQYAGSSIRITGSKGIRMITSIPTAAKNALTSSGIEGYKLAEYGTVVAWDTALNGESLTRSFSGARSAFAYNRMAGTDPIYAKKDSLIQYTNVLTNISNDKCVNALSMRPYMVLEDSSGAQITLYGGTVHRSIGYIAYQNRNAFAPGTESYNYIWGIIRYVYGTKYDSEYRV